MSKARLFSAAFFVVPLKGRLQDSNLPNHLLVIYDSGMGEMFCLNFKKVNDFGEPNVITFIPGIDLDKQDFTVIANDFGDFLLDLVKEETSY